MTTLRGILFDLDGTLANTLPICVQAYRQAAEQTAGRPYTAEEITTYFGATEEGIFQKLLPDQWQAGVQRYYDVYAQLQAACPEPFSGMREVLTLLQERGVCMAIVTGRGAFNTHRTLEFLRVAHFFDIVAVGEVNKVVKTQAIRDILKAWNITPQEAAYVGDTDTDMQEAHAAGVLPIGACWAETATIHHLPSTEGILLFNDVADFTRWLERHIVAIR